MSKTYTLTPDCYLSSLDDFKPKPGNPRSTLCVYLKDKPRNPRNTLCVDDFTATTNDPNTIPLKSGDKLIVHGTEIDESLWPELSKSLYLNDQAVVYDSRGRKTVYNEYCFLYVNSEGDTFLAFIGKSSHYGTYKELPVKFDWSRYGVRVPSSILGQKDQEIKKLKQQLKKNGEVLEAKDIEIQQLKHQLLKNNQWQLEGRDGELRLKEGRIEELQQQVIKLEEQLQGNYKDKWVPELVGRLSVSTSACPAKQEDLEQVNQKLDQVLSLLQNNNRGNSDWRCQYPLQPPAIIDPLSIIQTRCRDLVSRKFVVSSAQTLTSATVPRVQLRVSIEKLRVFVPVDESVDCLFPKKICVCVSDQRFDDKRWRFVKARDHHTTTMLAFYDGEFEQISVHGNHVFIPYGYRPETTFHSSTHEFFVGVIHGVGLRFMFLY